MSYYQHIARPVRSAAVVALAAVCLMATAGTASADQFTFDSGLVTTNEQVGTTDCRANYGPVRDPNPPAAGFRIIAGVQVTCSTRHASIGATVRQWVTTAGGATYELGTPAGTFGIGTVFGPNTKGFGDKILELNAGCARSQFPNGKFYTSVYITVDGRAYGWRYSPPGRIPGGNC